MKKVKDFIEAVDKKEESTHEKIFTVTFQRKFVESYNTFYIPLNSFGTRFDFKVLTLDEEDIKYLYDKYKPFLAAELEKQTEEEKAKILKEIETKSKQINKLSDEIREIKDKL